MLHTAEGPQTPLVPSHMVRVSRCFVLALYILGFGFRGSSGDVAGEGTGPWLRIKESRV